jgi:hypothetical protein
MYFQVWRWLLGVLVIDKGFVLLKDLSTGKISGPPAFKQTLVDKFTI